MDHISHQRPFHGSVDANEFTEAETYELLEVDHDRGGEPEAQGLLSEDVEAKPSLEEGEPPDVRRGEIDEFSMDEMVARVSIVSKGQGRLGMALTSCGKTVPSTDDPSLPSLTFRAIVLGSIFCVLGAAASQVSSTVLVYSIWLTVWKCRCFISVSRHSDSIHAMDRFMLKLTTHLLSH